MMGNFTTFLEEKLMPIATKFSTQRHLKAIRDAFICIMPITLAGGIVSVISAAPAPEGTTNGFLLAWAGFVSNNNMIQNLPMLEENHLLFLLELELH